MFKRYTNRDMHDDLNTLGMVIPLGVLPVTAAAMVGGAAIGIGYAAWQGAALVGGLLLGAGIPLGLGAGLSAGLVSIPLIRRGFSKLCDKIGIRQIHSDGYNPHKPKKPNQLLVVKMNENDLSASMRIAPVAPVPRIDIRPVKPSPREDEHLKRDFDKAGEEHKGNKAAPKSDIAPKP